MHTIVAFYAIDLNKYKIVCGYYKVCLLFMLHGFCKYHG